MPTLVLFDIDSTLVTGGPAKVSFETAMLELYGTAGPVDSYDFSGKTDPQIARELLVAVGLEDADIEPDVETAIARRVKALQSGEEVSTVQRPPSGLDVQLTHGPTPSVLRTTSTVV